VRRDLFTEDHEAFRELCRDFVEKEVTPHYPEWEKAGRMPREVFEQMGSLGGCWAWPSRRSTAGQASPTTATTW
jgi:alkylation response protein AidB-like acyl-CoA dehydrogenase